MAFASVFFLWLLPLAALPVIFHLLLKRRQKRLAFPDLMFFLKADPRMHARRRLREILLLAARALLLLLLLLTLSRPVLRNVPAVGGRIALVMVVDNSASMDAPTPDGQAKLDLAIEAARRLLDALDDGAAAAVVPLVADPANASPPALTTDRAELHRQLARIRRTEARGATAPAFARVRSLLASVPPGTRRSVHVFSDLHTVAWGVGTAGADPFDDADIVVHRIPSARRHEANITVDTLAVSHRVLLPGHACTLDVSLRNTSAAPGDVRVNIQNNQGELLSRRAVIGPGMIERIHYAFVPDTPGEYWVLVEVEGDAFRGDNRAGLALLCRDRAAVWFLGGRGHYGLMPLAIAPAGTGRHTALQPVFKEPDTLFDAPPEEPPVLLVGTWGHLARLPVAQAEALRDYVVAGGRLLVVPDGLAPAGDDDMATLPDWLGIQPGPRIRLTDDYVIGRILDPAADIWDGFHEALDKGRLQFFTMHRFTEFTSWSDYRVLAGINPRRPVMAERVMGAGRIVASGLAWDRRWSSLATDPSGIGVVMLHNMARGGLNATGAGATLLDGVAGETLPIPVAEGVPVAVRALAGDALETTLPAPIVPVRAGVYRVEADDRVFLASVRGSSDEAADTFLEADRLALLGATPHQVVTLASAGHDVARHLSAHFMGRSLFMPLAMLTLLIWAVEAGLSTLHGRPGRRIETRPSDVSADAVIP